MNGWERGRERWEVGGGGAGWKGGERMVVMEGPS